MQNGSSWDWLVMPATGEGGGSARTLHHWVDAFMVDGLLQLNTNLCELHTENRRIQSHRCPGSRPWLVQLFLYYPCLGLNNLSPDTSVFQKLPPKANSPLLNSFPESVFLNPTLNIDLPWRDLIYLGETGLTPPELSNREIEPWPSQSNNHPGWWQTGQGRQDQLLSLLWVSGTGPAFLVSLSPQTVRAPPSIFPVSRDVCKSRCPFCVSRTPHPGPRALQAP